MRVAPASREFSSSSFSTEAGRSTTSPAAILLATCSESTWIRPMNRIIVTRKSGKKPKQNLPRKHSSLRSKADFDTEQARRNRKSFSPCLSVSVVGFDFDYFELVSGGAGYCGSFSRVRFER